MVERRDELSALHTQRLTVTTQRQAILRVLNQSDRLLTANDIYEIVHDSSPSLSLITVYRTLRILIKIGLACEITTDRTAKKYVKSPAKPHGHLVCLKCGRYTDFPEPDLRAVVDQVRDASSYTIRERRLDVYGLCPECAKKL